MTAPAAPVYGFKITLIVDADGLPVDYYGRAGSFHDATSLQAMPIDLPPGSLLYGDSGYTDYEQEASGYPCLLVKASSYPLSEYGPLDLYSIESVPFYYS